MGTILILLALALPQHTPGKTNPAITQQRSCTTLWGKDHRYVTDKMKAEVAAQYGVARKDWHLYEFDHLISRELGGADDVANLWPQPIAEARVKDRIENLLHKRVCGGQLTLVEAQHEILKWWLVK